MLALVLGLLSKLGKGRSGATTFSQTTLNEMPFVKNMTLIYLLVSSFLLGVVLLSIILLNDLMLRSILVSVLMMIDILMSVSLVSVILLIDFLVNAI